MVVGLIAAGFFFTKNQSLEKSLAQAREKRDKLGMELVDAKAQTAELDKDLVFYKSPGLKKEVELLRFKLGEKERALASSKKEATDLKRQITSQEAKFPKAKVYLGIMDEVQKVYLSVEQLPVDSAGLNRIDTRISALSNAALLAKWEIVKRSTDIESSDWTAEYIGDMLAPVISNLSASLH